MRVIATVIATGLVMTAPALAAAQTPSTTAPPTPPANTAAAPPETTAPVTSAATPPPVPSNAARSAGAAGTNAQATAGAVQAVATGDPVKDNTGATIGEVTRVNSGANGQQMAVIKMGTDSFQAPTDRLGVANGVVTINMTQAQIEKMLHPNAGGH